MQRKCLLGNEQISTMQQCATNLLSPHLGVHLMLQVQEGA